MSATTGGPYSAAQGRDVPTSADANEGLGWVLFAASMLAIVSVVNFIYGIAAIDSANFYVADAQYVISDLSTWGWVMLGISSIQFAGAAGLSFGASWGRWIGILSAGVNAIAQLMWLPGSPFLSIALFSIDVLILYGLIARWGGRRQAL